MDGNGEQEMNRITLLGRMVADVELKQTPNGVSVVAFTIAVRRDKENTDFIDCVAWRQTAEFIDNYFRKGSTIAVDGSLRTRLYEKDGQKRKVVEVNVERAYFAGGTESGAKPKAQKETIGYDVNERLLEDGYDFGDLPF